MTKIQKLIFSRKQAFFALAFLFVFTLRPNVSLAADVNSPNAALGKKFEFAADRETGKIIALDLKKKTAPKKLGQTSKAKRLSSAKRFLGSYGKYFGLEEPLDELKADAEKKDSLGMHHLGFQQVQGGVPVFGARLTVHLSGGETQRANGRVVPGVDIATAPKISEDEARDTALEQYAAEYKNISGKILASKLYILNKNFLENKPSGENILAWKVDIAPENSQNPAGQEFFFVDAQTSGIAYHLSGTRKTIDRYILYGSGGDFLPGRYEGDPATGNGDVDKLYDYLGYSHDYFTQTFSRDGANGRGGLGDGFNIDYSYTVGYVDLDNGGLADFCPNAYFFGDSVGFCQGLVAFDIVGHEYGHAVNYHSVVPDGLVYAGQSGALDEGFSDIWGEAIEDFHQEGDWVIGEDAVIPGYPSPLRSLADPASIDYGYGPYPDRMYADGYYCGEDNLMMTHQNSTVLSHAAYLAAVGGSSNGCRISPIGAAKQEVIFYRALTNYLAPTATFADAYWALNYACSDMVGGMVTVADCAEMKKALQAAEMNQAGRCSGVARVIPECAVTSNVNTLAYSGSKKTKRTVILSLNGVTLPKKKYVTVRFAHRKVKVRWAKNISGVGTIAVDLKYGKWPVGSYDLSVVYKNKVGKHWETKSAASSALLSIVNP